MVQTIADGYNQEDLAGLRVLDLGCLEGLFSIELARHGAEVVAIDVRSANLAKARFAAEMAGVSIDFYHDDAIEATAEKYGQFDVVLFCGLLYHLNVSNILTVLQNISVLTKRMVLIDTCYALEFDEQFERNGKNYYGQSYVEFHDRDFPQKVEKASWSASRDKYVFFLTAPSLVRLLVDFGFSSVYSTLNPASRGVSNRGLFVGYRNRRLPVKTGTGAFKAMQDMPILERPNPRFGTPGKGRPLANPETQPI